MKNIIKVLCGCFAVVIIFTIFIVPVTMAFTSSPSYTCGFETNADYNNYKSRARIRVTDFTDNWVYYSAYSVSNMGDRSSVEGYMMNATGTYYGDWVATDCTYYPLVTSYGGTAYYDSPF